MKYGKILSSLIMGAILAQSTTGSTAHMSTFILSNLWARNVIKLFIDYATENITLYDFTKVNNLDEWNEISDTVRVQGMSKATLTLQKTQLFQRGVFFTLLNPQPNGAGFAGVRMHTQWNLTDYRNIEIKCRGQGVNDHYKIVLRHKGKSTNEDISYEQFFTVPLTTEEFSTICLPLEKFKAYYRGREIPNAEPLDTSNITMFGLQVYGGVYSQFKQKGVSALEVETILATI